MEAFEQGKIAQRDDGVVCEIYGIMLVLWMELGSRYVNSAMANAYPCNSQIFDGRDFVAYRGCVSSSNTTIGSSNL